MKCGYSNRKMLLFLLCLSIVSGKVTAQLAKGDFLAGGNLSFQNSRNFRQDQLTDKGINIQASPGFGYFLVNRLATGVRLNYNYSSSKNLVSGTSYRSYGWDLGAGPFVRYYFLPEAKKINLLAEASYVFNFYKTVSGGTSFTNDMQTLGISAGPAIFLNPKLALEILAGYRRQQVNKDNFIGQVFLIQFGLQFYPGRLVKK